MPYQVNISNWQGIGGLWRGSLWKPDQLTNFPCQEGKTQRGHNHMPCEHKLLKVHNIHRVSLLCLLHQESLHTSD